MNQPPAPELTDAAIWPLTGLRVVAGDLELRYLDDSLLLDLARLAARGVHAADRMPFVVPWTRGEPIDVARSVLAYQWGARSRISPESWNVELAVLVAGEPVGVQGISAQDFPVTGVVETGSWLGRELQGRGIGTRMRSAVLHLVFEGLGALDAVTSAFEDNQASNGVTRRLGYVPDGEQVQAREGRRATLVRYRLRRAAWEAARPAGQDVVLHGVDGVRRLLGIAEPV